MGLRAARRHSPPLSVLTGETSLMSAGVKYNDDGAVIASSLVGPQVFTVTEETIRKMQEERMNSAAYSGLFEVVAPRYRAAAMGVYLCGAFLIGCPATAVLGYVGEHFSYQHGIAMFGGAYALAALAVVVARWFFFAKDRV